MNHWEGKLWKEWEREEWLFLFSKCVLEILKLTHSRSGIAEFIIAVKMVKSLHLSHSVNNSVLGTYRTCSFFLLMHCIWLFCCVSMSLFHHQPYHTCTPSSCPLHIVTFTPTSCCGLCLPVAHFCLQFSVAIRCFFSQAQRVRWPSVTVHPVICVWCPSAQRGNESEEQWLCHEICCDNSVTTEYKAGRSKFAVSFFSGKGN